MAGMLCAGAWAGQAGLVGLFHTHLGLRLGGELLAEASRRHIRHTSRWAEGLGLG